MENIGGVLLERVSIERRRPSFPRRTVRRFSQQFAHEVGITSPGPHLEAGNEVIIPGRIARATGLRRETTPWNFESADLRRFDLFKLAAPKRLPTSSTSPLEGSFPPQKNGG